MMGLLPAHLSEACSGHGLPVDQKGMVGLATSLLHAGTYREGVGWPPPATNLH